MTTCREEGCGRPRRQQRGRTDPLCEECHRALLERVARELREEETAAAGRRRYRRYRRFRVARPKPAEGSAG